MTDLSSACKAKLATCDKRLWDLFTEVQKVFPCVIVEGHRDKAAQDAAVAAGKSKLPWPKGNHNSMPSKAVDAVPDPIEWTNYSRQYLFAGVVLGIAASKGMKIRWGGDWAGHLDPAKNHFPDLDHFELVD